MNNESRSHAVTHRFQIRQLLSMVLFVFIVSIVADVIVDSLAPATGSAQDSFRIILNEMRSSTYWLRKLGGILVVGILYALVLWYRTSKNSKRAQAERPIAR
jgi:hypothetical protein